MKSIVTILAALVGIGAFAQEMDTLKTTQNTDTTRIELGKTHVTIVKNLDDADEEKEDRSDRKKALTWWTGIDLGVNGVLGENHDFQLGESDFMEPKYGRSRYISFNFAEIKGRIVKDYVGITTGLTFQFYNYKYGGSDEFVFSGDTSLSVQPSGDKNITKNKIRATYLGVPLMLEINTSQDPSKSFHISAGVIGKVLIGDMYKQKYTLDGNDRKDAIKGDLGFTRWTADAIVRVGYGHFTLFAQVGLAPLFQDDVTPNDVYTFSSGICLTI